MGRIYFTSMVMSVYSNGIHCLYIEGYPHKYDHSMRVLTTACAVVTTLIRTKYKMTKAT